MAAATNFYVDLKCQIDTPDGTSWRSAYSSLQDAIDAANKAGGGDIWVKAGIYKPEGLSRNAAIELKPDIALYGGFRGNESALDQRNPKANRTILSGDIGRGSTASDNSYHVLLGANGCRVDGFIITRGNANAVSENRYGGGILLPPDTKNVTVANCTFEKNYAESGGAIHAQSTELTISNCTFYANSAESGGALASSGPTELAISDSIFSSNFSPGSGGAVSLTTSAKVRFVKSTFLYNASDAQGGALSAKTEHSNGIELEITQCVFAENSGRKGGGALFLSGRFNPHISESTFERNASVQGAGAIMNEGGIIAIASNSSFTGNLGIKGSEIFGNDDSSFVVYSKEAAQELAEKLKPSGRDNARKTAVVEKQKPTPEPKHQLGDEFVHNAQGTKVKLKSLVAENEHTVLVLGDLTDVDFIKTYRNVEAAARDYPSNGIGFYYIYRYLLHPENNGYVQPFNLKERARQIILAKEILSTGIPWLCDTMENQTAHSLSPMAKNSVFIFNKQGSEIYSAPLSSDTEFRKALIEIAGPADQTFDMNTLTIPLIQPLTIPETKLVKRIELNSKTAEFLPLQTTPLESTFPHYVKIRVEGDESIRTTGDGQLYLGFHIDPLYKTEWNNLGDPPSYILKTPIGVVAPSINSAPRITEQATDTEPREFLLNARKLDINKAIALQVTYSVHASSQQRNIDVQQQYLVYLEEDPFGGKVFGRQRILEAKSDTARPNSTNNAFTLLLRRFDLDRNGNLTEDEVIGGLSTNFSEIDTDHDGAITEEEYMYYRENR